MWLPGVSRGALSIVLVSFACGVTVTALSVPQYSFGDVPGSRGAVACEAKECSAIGRDILARGGNAVDAMVGTTFCVGVVGNYHSGVGGGGFALVRDADGNYEAIDFRESAPNLAHEDMYKKKVNESVIGGLAVGVPSEVRGLEYMHQKYGVLPWETVMRGAIHVARNGFNVSKDLTLKMDGMFANNYTFLVDDDSFAQDFAPNGVLVKEGEIMTRKRYANTLERIAKSGSKVFYEGEIAASIATFVRENGGILTEQDMRDYQVISRPVKSIRYRGLDVYGMGSPAGGAVALQILKVMENYEPGMWQENPALTIHRFAEAMRFAYAARGELGDPAFVDKIDVDRFEHQMISNNNTKHVWEQILDDHTQEPSKYSPNRIWMPDTHGTSHLVSTDKSGMAVSLTTTINLIFGAQIMEPNTGIILNNEMNDFSIPGVDNEFGFKPSEANFIRPNKRPLSSMTPLIASYPNGTFYAAFGAAGGSRIISATAQVLWHTVEHNMTMTETLTHPRMHDQLFPNRLNLEHGFPDEESTLVALHRQRHNVSFVGPGASSAQAIKLLSDGAFEAVGEPRQYNSAGVTL